MSKYKFECIPSGDHDGFCFDVDEKTFEKLSKIRYERLVEIWKERCGEDWLEKDGMPWDEFIKYEKEFAKSLFNDELYRIYPNMFFENKDKVSVEIIVNED